MLMRACFLEELGFAEDDLVRFITRNAWHAYLMNLAAKRLLSKR
jgi:hypothetical protein